MTELKNYSFSTAGEDFLELGSYESLISIIVGIISIYSIFKNEKRESITHEEKTINRLIMDIEKHTDLTKKDIINLLRKTYKKKFMDK